MKSNLTSAALVTLGCVLMFAMGTATAGVFSEAAKRYDDLDRGDKRRALVTRKAAEGGDYLGDPLTKQRCDSVRRLLFLEYK